MNDIKKNGNGNEYDTAAIQQADNRFVHPWEEIESYGGNSRTILTAGDGVYVRDSRGNRLLDGPGGMWCVNVGHGNTEIADAINQQVRLLSYASAWSLSNAPASLLAEKISSLAPGDLNHVFFTTGGSTAVDSALRFVMFRNNYLGLKNKKHFISRTNAYHGSTFLAASMSGKGRDKNYQDFHEPFTHFISDPAYHRDGGGMSPEEYNRAKASELEECILRIGAENVAAFIAEPVLASGGVIVPPPGYFAACWEVCQRYDVVFIADETVTAFGRLGHFFSTQEVFGVTPDIIICAKGLTSGYVPLGAMIVSERLIASMRGAQKSGGVFANGYTYSGHPLAAAAALKNIEIMERPGFMEHAREMGNYFAERIHEMEDLDIVANTRAIGLMGCVECRLPGVDDSLIADYALGERIDKYCQELGLLVRPLINMCVMSPPLVINRAQIDEMFGILRQGIVRVASEMEK